MKQNKIDSLQKSMFDLLEEFYFNLGFKPDRENWCFRSEKVSVLLYPDTRIGSYYTLRPGIEIILKELKDFININIDSYKISRNSHFFLDHKLAQVFDIKNLDSCEENNFGRDQIFFNYTIKNNNDIIEFVNRHKFILDQYGIDLINKLSEESNYYDLLKKISFAFFHDWNSFPNKKLVDRPLKLKRESFLSLFTLGFSYGDQEIESIYSLFEEVYGSDSEISNYVKKL